MRTNYNNKLPLERHICVRIETCTSYPVVSHSAVRSHSEDICVQNTVFLPLLSSLPALPSPPSPLFPSPSSSPSSLSLSPLSPFFPLSLLSPSSLPPLSLLSLSLSPSSPQGGVLWVWGFGDYGQLGLGDRHSRLVPTRLGAEEVFGGSRVRMAACGNTHTLLVTEEGVVWAFGRGEHGRAGLNDEDDRLVPTCVDPQSFGGAQVTTVAGGYYHSAAVTEGGALFTWGRGEADDTDDAGSKVPGGLGSKVPGGLGHADLRNRLVPTLVSPRLLGFSRVGLWHGLAEELAMAFAMGTHARLGASVGGAGGGCPYFMMPGDLVKRVVEACRWGAGGEAKDFGEGVLRLMGAERTRRFA